MEQSERADLFSHFSSPEFRVPNQGKARLSAIEERVPEKLPNLQKPLCGFRLSAMEDRVHEKLPNLHTFSE